MTEKTNDWISWTVGIVSGVALWFVLKPAVKKGPGVTRAAEMPVIASPGRFANLESVALRLDQIKTLYRSGRLTPIQAMAEAEGLMTAANSFSEAEGERTAALLLHADALLFQTEVQDYMHMQQRPA